MAISEQNVLTFIVRLPFHNWSSVDSAANTILRVIILIIVID